MPTITLHLLRARLQEAKRPTQQYYCAKKSPPADDGTVAMLGVVCLCPGAPNGTRWPHPRLRWLAGWGSPSRGGQGRQGPVHQALDAGRLLEAEICQLDAGDSTGPGLGRWGGGVKHSPAPLHSRAMIEMPLPLKLEFRELV